MNVLRSLRQYIYSWYWRFLGVEIGRGSLFCISCTKSSKSEISVGENVYIGPKVHFGTSVRIGSDVLIAQSAAFVGGDHFIPGDDQLIRKAGRPTMKSISIEPDVWIGYGAIIVDGITIGRGAVIGAGTVISKDVESYAVVTGTSYTFRRRR